jgi:hypothetical protein
MRWPRVEIEFNKISLAPLFLLAPKRKTKRPSRCADFKVNFAPIIVGPADRRTVMSQMKREGN